MKKTLSIILATMMLFSVISGVNMSALAAANNIFFAEEVPTDETVIEGLTTNEQKRDYYKFTIDVKSDVRITAISYYYCDFTLYNTDKTVNNRFGLRGKSSSPDDATRITTLESGTYYISVEDYYSGDCAHDKYFFQLKATPLVVQPAAPAITGNDTEPNNYSDEAMTLNENELLKGALSANDKFDWFSFDVTNSSYVDIVFNNKMSDEALITIYNEDQNYAYSYDVCNGDHNWQLVKTQYSKRLYLNPGKYFILISSESNGDWISQSTDATGEYTIKWKYYTSNTNTNSGSNTNNTSNNNSNNNSNSSNGTTTVNNTTINNYTTNQSTVNKTTNNKKTVNNSTVNTKNTNVNITVNVNTPAVITLRRGKKQLSLIWKKTGGASGYQVEYSTKKNFKNSKKYTTKKTNKTVKKLKAGKKYYFRVRAYKTENGKRLYGKFSAVKTAKPKK